MDIERLVSGATETLSVRRCFGPPVEQAGTLVIPVAFVAGGGGGGAGAEGPEAEGKQGKGADAKDVRRTGQGGGFGGVVWPLGVYVLQDGRVRWVPAVDATRIVLGALALARAVVKIRLVARSRPR